MTSLDIIQSPIKEELKSFESYFKEAIKSDIPLLQIIIRYILRKKGEANATHVRFPFGQNVWWIQ